MSYGSDLTMAGAIALMVFMPGCLVLQSTHDKVLAQLDGTGQDLEKTRKEFAGERESWATEKKGLQETLASVRFEKNSIAAARDKLGTERDRLAAERDKLAAKTAASERMLAAAEASNADFRRLVEKLKKMMDAGTLEVKIRNGRMVVQMSSDVVFPPASIRIKAEAGDALAELAQALASFEGRRFQVMGHCDSKPIRSARFPSNWELSTQRAVEVVKLLVEQGVRPEMISAAGNAEFDPIADNEIPEDRALNRRVEIVFLPKIDELPGFDKVLSKD